MAIDPDLLEILACPLCKVKVTPTRDGGGLRCGECRRVYPIIDDIPVMLVEEASFEVKTRPKASPPKRKTPRPKARVKPKGRSKARS